MMLVVVLEPFSLLLLLLVPVEESFHYLLVLLGLQPSRCQSYWT
jgi:hypothetical protein